MTWASGEAAVVLVATVVVVVVVVVLVVGVVVICVVGVVVICVVGVVAVPAGVEVAPVELMVIDDATSTVADDTTVGLTFGDDSSDTPSEPPLQAARAATNTAAEAATFHALLMIASPLGGC